MQTPLHQQPAGFKLFTYCTVWIYVNKLVKINWWKYAVLLSGNGRAVLSPDQIYDTVQGECCGS